MIAFTQLINKARWLYLAALLLGIIQALAFDGRYDSWWRYVAPLCSGLSLWGYLYCLKSLPTKRAAIFGYCFGLGYLGWGLNWIYISMARFGDAPLAFALFANAIVVVFLSLYWLLGSYAIAKVGKTSNHRLLLAAPITVLFEWLRGHFLIGFPWLSLGYAWIDTPIAHLASYGGISLLSASVIFVIAISLLDIRRIHKYLLFIKILAVLGIFSIPFFPLKSTNTLSVALIQGNMPVITEYNDQRMTENLVTYRQLTESALANNNHVDAVIWPESAIPYYYEDASVFLDDMLTLQQQHQFDFITGMPDASWRDNVFYNSVFLLPQQTDHDIQRYVKYHLLPFGEYLPFRELLAFFNDYVSIPMADFSSGTAKQPAFVINHVKLAPSICFEAVFGDEIRKNAINAEVLLNVSNDAWFGESKALSQHLTIARLRAIENQKFLIRATNTGLTAIIAPNGRVTQSIPPFQSGYVMGIINAYEQKTLYARYGDKPWLLFFALWIISVFLLCRKSR